MVTKKKHSKKNITSKRLSSNIKRNITSKVLSSNTAPNNTSNAKSNNTSNVVVSNKILTIPNILSFIRILLAPIIMLLLINTEYVFALILVIIASLTDFFDGYIARKYSMQSKLGGIIDPLGDKLLMLCVIIALIVRFAFPLGVAIIIIGRDLLILLAGLIFICLGKKAHLKPSTLGKVSTFFQMSTIIIYLLASIIGYYALWIDILMYLTVVITIISGVGYVVKGYQIFKNKCETNI